MDLTSKNVLLTSVKAFLAPDIQKLIALVFVTLEKLNIPLYLSIAFYKIGSVCIRSLINKPIYYPTSNGTALLFLACYNI